MSEEQKKEINKEFLRLAQKMAEHAILSTDTTVVKTIKSRIRWMQGFIDSLPPNNEEAQTE